VSQASATQTVAHLHEDAAQMVLPASAADAPERVVPRVALDKLGVARGE